MVGGDEDEDEEDDLTMARADLHAWREDIKALREAIHATTKPGDVLGNLDSRKHLEEALRQAATGFDLAVIGYIEAVKQSTADLLAAMAEGDDEDEDDEEEAEEEPAVASTLPAPPPFVAPLSPEIRFAEEAPPASAPATVEGTTP